MGTRAQSRLTIEPSTASPWRASEHTGPTLHAPRRSALGLQGSSVPRLEPHFLDFLGLDEGSLGGFDHLSDRNPGRGLKQHGTTVHKADDGELGHDEVYA